MVLFTKNHSIEDILKTDDLRKYIGILFPVMLCDMVPESYKNVPLAVVEQKVKMPWGAPFLADDLVRAANHLEEIIYDRSYEFIPLWKEESADRFLPEVEKNSKESVCLMTSNVFTKREKPAVIICPGGGYEVISMYAEGLQMAERMEDAGYKAFILNYRVSPNRYPKPQMDLGMAIKYVRANAEKYHIDPNQIMVIGSSAGGHLCASMTLYSDEIERLLMEELKEEEPHLADRYEGISIKPDKICLNYPVISFMEEAHEPSFHALTGTKENLRNKLSVEMHVDNSYPQTFVWACEDDELVPSSNAIRMDKALEDAGVLHELKIYPAGGHGCGLAEGTSAEGWMDEMLIFMHGEKKEVEPEYYAQKIDADTFLIGCDYEDFGKRSGKETAFGNPTGNSYLIIGADCAVLIDSAAHLEGLRAFAENVAGKPVMLVLSHAHPDHTYRLKEFDEFWIHPKDEDLLHGAYGWEAYKDVPEKMHYLNDGDIIDLKNGHKLHIFHIPGHTDGSILLWDEYTKLLFSGDSIGRRLLYGTCGWVPVKNYISSLERIKELDIAGIYSCHDRKRLVKEIIDFEIEGIKKLPNAKDEIQYTPEMTPLVYIRSGNEKEMFFLDCSYPKTEQCVKELKGCGSGPLV